MTGKQKQKAKEKAEKRLFESELHTSGLPT